MIYAEIEERGKGDSSIESQGIEWTRYLSKLLLREEPWCV